MLRQPCRDDSGCKLACILEEAEEGGPVLSLAGCHLAECCAAAVGHDVAGHTSISSDGSGCGGGGMVTAELPGVMWSNALFSR